MTHIDYPERDALPEPTRTFLAQAPPLNVFLMWAHSPDVMTQAALLGVAQMTHLELAADMRELAILACGQLFEAPYEWDQHVPVAKAQGIDGAQLEALAVRYFTSSRFSPAQQALLALVAAVAAGPRVPDRVLTGFRCHFGDRELVEVIGLVGYYFMVGRVTTVLGIASDPPGGTQVVEAAQRIDADT